MKKIKVLIFSLFIFVLGFKGVKADAISYDELYQALTKNNVFYVKIEKTDTNKFKLTLLETENNLDPDYNQMIQGYEMILDYENGVLSYTKNRDESGFSDKKKANYSIYDATNFVMIFEQIDNAYFPNVDKELFPSADEILGNSSKYGVTLTYGNDINYTDGGEEINGKEINNFSIDIEKYMEAIRQLSTNKSTSNTEEEKTVEETKEVIETKKESVKNPQTGIEKPYFIVGIIVLVSLCTLLVIRNKKIFVK